MYASYTDSVVFYLYNMENILIQLVFCMPHTQTVYNMENILIQLVLQISMPRTQTVLSFYLYGIDFKNILIQLVLQICMPHT